jgi:hypothetical protein
MLGASIFREVTGNRRFEQSRDSENRRDESITDLDLDLEQRSSERRVDFRRRSRLQRNLHLLFAATVMSSVVGFTCYGMMLWSGMLDYL